MNRLSICHFIVIIFLGSCSFLTACTKESGSEASEYTTSLVPVESTAKDRDTSAVKERTHKPLIWEIKWSSRRVIEKDSNHNNVCKTEFTNPYSKSIKEIKVGYEIKYEDQSESVNYEKVIELNLRPNEKKVIDTGIGCRDFYMYEVIFEDGEVI